MNWYKRVYADYQPMDVDALTYKLKMLGIEKVRPDKGTSGKLKGSGHARFNDPHSGTQSDVPVHRQEISGNTIKTHIVDFFNLGEVWKDLGPRPKNKTIKRLSPLFPWNKNKKEQEAAAAVTKQKSEEEKARKKQEFLDAQPWNIMGEDILEKARLDKIKDEEETKEIERMIAEDDAARKAQEGIKPALMPSMGEIKMNWYKKARGVPGGLADKKKPSDFNPKQIEKGLKVELEHTEDRELSKDIAMDHLEEFPAYYTELDKMEKKLEKKKPARRGRYQGQLQGDENRPDNQVMDDIIRDNEVVEGPHVKILHNHAVAGNWDGFNAYVQRLKDEGHKQTRIDSMMTRAMYKVKL